MRIAIFSDNFYPELSGITDAILLLGKALEERGHTILFVGPYYGKKNYAKANLPEELLFISDTNIGVKRLLSFSMLSSPTGQSRIVVPLGKSIYLMKKFKPDIIYTNSPFGVGWEALIAAKLLGIPLVGTNHTPIGEFMAYSPIRFKWLTRLALGYFSWYYNRCDYVTAPCESLLNEMKEYGFHGPNQKLPNAVELGRFTPPTPEERTALRKQFGFDEPVILYTGRLAPEKNIDVIIKAVGLVKKTVPDIKFIITGHGSAELPLKKLAGELGLLKNIGFMGFLDEASFPLIYKASDIFVIMSRAESQSLSLMQAMASGLAVIGARARALPEYIDANSGIIVELNDYEQLAEKILQILGDDELKRRLSGGGQKSVLNYTPQNIAELWESVYADTIARTHLNNNR